LGNSFAPHWSGDNIPNNQNGWIEEEEDPEEEEEDPEEDSKEDDDDDMEMDDESEGRLGKDVFNCDRIGASRVLEEVTPKPRNDMSPTIEIDIFNFERPLCKAYKEHKIAWIYEWNKDISWVANMPWGYCNGEDPRGMIQIRDEIYFESHEWYQNLEECELKDKALNYKAMLVEPMNVEEESKKQGWFKEYELMEDDDDYIDDEDYLIQKDPLYYVNEEEEKSKEKRCKLLGIPCVKPPT
nr:hypothetical protein [Tanacetum cinerariifolium]